MSAQFRNSDFVASLLCFCAVFASFLDVHKFEDALRQRTEHKFVNSDIFLRVAQNRINFLSIYTSRVDFEFCGFSRWE